MAAVPAQQFCHILVAFMEGRENDTIHAIMLTWNLEALSLRLKLALVVFVAGAMGTITYGQQGTIPVENVPSSVISKAFTTTPVGPLKNGTVPAHFVIGDGGRVSLWDVRAHEFVIDGRTVKFPTFGIAKCSASEAEGNCLVAASTTVITADLRAGEVAHSGDYVIEATRAVKAGEAVPTLLFMGKKARSILSIEASPETKDKGDAVKPQPWLTIFEERLKTSDRAVVVETWRESNKTVASLLAVPGMLTSDK